MIDFSKAFDKVDIRLMLRKLRSLGGSDSFLELLLVVMSGRKQIVLVNGVHSDSASICSGLPQGSVFSPSLFKVYLNDLLSSDFETSPYGFAYDLKLLSSSNSDIEPDLLKITDWSSTNKMVINTSKCKALYFGTKNSNTKLTLTYEIISVSNSSKDLGIKLDNCLKFTNHANAVQLKCLRFIGLIFQLFYTRNADTIIKLNFTYVISTIDYGAIIYTNISRNVQRSIEKI